MKQTDDYKVTLMLFCMSRFAKFCVSMDFDVYLDKKLVFEHLTEEEANENAQLFK